MLANELKNAKIFKSGGLIYSAIGILYLVALVIAFVYALDFLTKNLNMTFAPVAPQNINQNYTSLNMVEYNSLAPKFKFSPQSSPALPAVTDDQAKRETILEATPAPESLEISPEMTPEQSPINPPEQRTQLKISVINSTSKNGLAAELKKQLNAAGYPVEKIGNQKLTEINTIIKMKSDLDNNPTALEIKRIVAGKYSPITALLPNSSPYDLEIVIGQK